MGNLHAHLTGAGKRAVLANRKLHAHFAGGFALLISFVFRITEGNDDRIYESGEFKISE